MVPRCEIAVYSKGHVIIFASAILKLSLPPNESVVFKDSDNYDVAMTANSKSSLFVQLLYFCLIPPPLSTGLDIRQAQVIVLTSGTKCINGEYINDQGLVVNDCHAEIVARRAFLHFLYSQLELHLR